MPAELNAIRDALADAEIRIAVMERELDVARSESASLRKLLKDQADLTESVKQARDWYQDRLAKVDPDVDMDDLLRQIDLDYDAEMRAESAAISLAEDGDDDAEIDRQIEDSEIERAIDAARESTP